MDFQSKKSFGKLRLRAFQPYHQRLCMAKHIKDVKDYFDHQHLQHASTYINFVHSTVFYTCYVSQHL